MHAPGDESLDEASGSGSSFKVFGRSGAEALYTESEEERPPEVAPEPEDPEPAPHATRTPSLPARRPDDDPFAALASDGALLIGGLDGSESGTTAHSAHAHDEVLEPDFHFTPRPAPHTAPRVSKPLPRAPQPESIEAEAPASRATAAPAAPTPTPKEAQTAPPESDTGSDGPTESVTAARPDWYRDPACWVHLLPLAGSVLLLTGIGLLPALLIENTAGRRDDFVRDQAREAVNFQLNYLLLNLAALVTFTAPVVWPLSIAFGIVLPIQAALDVKDGKRHRYPLVPRWLDPR